MAWADEIASLNTLIDRTQEDINWINGVNGTYSVSVDIDGTTYTEERTCAGRDGFWGGWRTDNPTASESSTGLELHCWLAWRDWDTGNVAANDSAKLTALNTQLTNLTADRDDLQAKVDDPDSVDAGA